MQIEIPEKLGFLFEPYRYKITHGGRGSAKSWGYARALLTQGIEQKHRILCAREFQSSIKESVHSLLSQQISILGLESFYEIQQASIIGKNGTEFVFAGLRHNVNGIKSMEGISRAWVEEAVTVSKASWDVLVPTIRKEGSEIWVTFNSELETDETYVRFVKNPPSNSIVVNMNWRDNPWFPEVLRQEKDDLKARDENAYLNVWEGHCKQTLEGAVYAKELRDATFGERITKVPYSASKPVDIFFDLGWSDNTSMWFIQRIGFELRAIRAYQNRHQALNHYLQYIQAQQYVIGTIWLPHDARAKQIGTGMSVEEMVRAAGYTVRIVPMLSVDDGINALRTIFPNIYWDADNCADGIQALRRYRYKVDPITQQLSREPLHDDASHFADAARYFAVAMHDPKPKKITRTIEISRSTAGGSAGWMG